MKQRIICFLGIMLYLLLGQPVIAETILKVDQKSITLDKEAIYRQDGVSMIYAAPVLRSLGYRVVWNNDEEKLMISPANITLTMGNKKVSIDYKTSYLEAVPTMKRGRVYVPIKFFSNVLGYDISYKGNQLSISGKEAIGQPGSYEEEKRITISAAGDFTLGRYVGQGVDGRFDEVARVNGLTHFMKGVKEIFQADDLTIVNLEGPLTVNGVAAQKEFAIRGLPEYVDILKDGDIEVVNLANNHTFDYGQVGYSDTKSLLGNNNIGYFGKEQTYYTTINGIRVAVIGESAWSNSKAMRNTIKERISQAKQKADLIIVEFHWGIERENYPASYQVELAKYAVDQGAHLILGSHPHVIQGIGNYKGANIIYSMGNFCFGANRNPSDKDTFIYQETFVLTDQGIKSEGNEIIPCSISSSSNKNDYQPTVLTGEAKERVLKRLEKYSKNLK